MTSTMSRVVVCGSLNMDVVVQSRRRPLAGETLLGARVSFLAGGKGLNQAIASARLGTPTAMVGAVGTDAFADELRAFLANNDVDSSGVREIEDHATGVALIQVGFKHHDAHVALLDEDCAQRKHSLREVFNGVRWMVRTCAPWRMMPNDLPPWEIIYLQSQRWIKDGYRVKK